MINLFPESDNSKVIQEAGMIDSVLKTTLNVDADAVRKSMNNSNNSLNDKISTVDKQLSNATDTTSAIDKVLNGNRVDSRSIIARARNSVLQFPIYIDQTVRVNEGHIIGKLFERVYATLVQAVLSQNQIIDEDQANNLVFLKQFHSNIKEAADVFADHYNQYYEPIDDIDKMISESVFYTQKITENCTVEFRCVPTTNDILIQENARLMNEPLTGFLYLREAENKETTSSKKIVTDEKKLNYQDFKVLAYDYKEKGKGVLTDREKEIIDNYNNTTAPDAEKQAALQKFQDVRSKIQEDIKNGKMSGYEFINGEYIRKKSESSTTIKTGSPRTTPVEDAVDAPKLLRDSDIKKMNGMLPYTIEATFRMRGKNGINSDIKFIIGIKSVMHLIRTQDLADDLRDLVTGDIKSLRKVRYKTGEISFKDYMFNIKGIKADAAKHVNYEKRWINTLKRLAEYNKTNGSFLKKPIQAITGGDVPIPNGTLILTQPAVTTLTNQTGIDLSVVANAKRLAKTLFLIGVVIVDSSAGTMRVLFPDSDNDWDVQSLASIDAELAKTDNSQIMKELNKLVNR